MEWLAIIVPSALWAQAVWASPFLRTHRHRLSGILSILAGLLLFAALKMQLLLLFWIGCAVLGSMLATLLWPAPCNRQEPRARQK